jgi:hypothetical protein
MWVWVWVWVEVGVRVLGTNMPLRLVRLALKLWVVL